MVSSEDEFNIVANEMVKDLIDVFEECIEKIRNNCSNEQKRDFKYLKISLQYYKIIFM